MKLPTIVLLVFLTSNCIAQDNKFALSVQINTQEQVSYSHVTNYGGVFARENNERDNYYSFSGVVKYNLKNNTSLRLKVGFSKLSFGSDTTYHDSTYETNSNQSAKQTNYHFALGIEKEIITGKVNLYVGFQTPVNIYGQTTYESLYEYHFISTGVIWYSNQINGRQKNGFSIGLSGFTGFAFNITNRFAVFGEYSFAIMYAKIGGEDEFTSVSVQSGTINKITVTTVNNKFEKFGVLEQVGSFGLSFKL